MARVRARPLSAELVTTLAVTVTICEIVAPVGTPRVVHVMGRSPVGIKKPTAIAAQTAQSQNDHEVAGEATRSVVGAMVGTMPDGL